MVPCERNGTLYEPGYRALSLSRVLRYCSRFVYLIGPDVSYIRAREPEIRDTTFVTSSSLKFITIIPVVNL